MQPLRQIRQLLGSLLLQRNHRHVDTLAARALQHQKREAPVSSDESPSCRLRLWHEGRRLAPAAPYFLLLDDTAFSGFDELNEFRHVRGFPE